MSEEPSTEDLERAVDVGGSLMRFDEPLQERSVRGFSRDGTLEQEDNLVPATIFFVGPEQAIAEPGVFGSQRKPHRKGSQETGTILLRRP
jgi:hypothetical protein